MSVILYECPLNERLRTYLRLESLYLRLFELVDRETGLDHHFALLTIFEIMEVAGRSDLKSDVLRDIERQKGYLEALRSNPAIAQDKLTSTLKQLDLCYTKLHSQIGRVGQPLLDEDMLRSARSRGSTPGGISGFDIPLYHRWQHLSARQRQQDLLRWLVCLRPLADSLMLLLELLRSSASSRTITVHNGTYEQALNPSPRPFQLLRLGLNPAQGLVPEISANHLKASVRLMRPCRNGMSLEHARESASFELTLCA